MVRVSEHRSQCKNLYILEPSTWRGKEEEDKVLDLAPDTILLANGLFHLTILDE